MGQSAACPCCGVVFPRTTTFFAVRHARSLPYLMSDPSPPPQFNNHIDGCLIEVSTNKSRKTSEQIEVLQSCSTSDATNLEYFWAKVAVKKEDKSGGTAISTKWEKRAYKKN